MNAEQKLAAIAALCDESRSIVRTADVRAVLDAPSVPAAQPHDADADAAWQAYKEREWHGWDTLHADLHAAFLAGWVARPVRSAARAGGIDRDALERLLEEFELLGLNEQSADRVLALVQSAPPALDLAVVRRILTDALPADPKWAVWVDGVVERLSECEEVS